MAVAADSVPGAGCQSDLGAVGDCARHFGDHFWIPSVFAVYGHSSSVVLIHWTGWIVVGDGRQNDFCFLGFGRTGFGRNADLHGVVSGLLMRLDSSG